jgi:hypothetical protein
VIWKALNRTVQELEYLFEPPIRVQREHSVLEVLELIHGCLRWCLSLLAAQPYPPTVGPSRASLQLSGQGLRLGQINT